ncbi:MAG: class I SAM-dependent methyltransferase, partial [Flavobacteriales bacterium]|nr:class I SAM-dependent methyltransferase [Flavobacteriales bacterium]
TTLDFSSLNQKFDLIFVDGSHHYEDVKKDTMNVFNLLKDENSIIIWHDYLNTSSSVRWEVFRGILDGTPQDKRGKLSHISNTLFAMYSNKDYVSHEMELHPDPNKIFELKISASPILK